MRVLSGIKPSGSIHLGNYLGALRQWAAEQNSESFFAVVDLHALTLPIEPDEVRQQTLSTAAALLAVGIDPSRSTLFLQSAVPQHTRLAWLLECVSSYGELRRMTQFKDKAGEQGAHRVGFFTYPVLMAADILLYDAELVPVGDDQRQHLELARTIAERFNARYGETFVVPDGLIPKAGARVMDLQNPLKKMSKSETSPLGTIGLFDSPDEIDRKVKRAVTDVDGEMRLDRRHKPGLTNLVEILAALTGESPKKVVARFTQYGPLKAELSERLIETLTPIREHHSALMADPAEIMLQFERGSAHARDVAQPVYERAARAMGIVG